MERSIAASDVNYTPGANGAGSMEAAPALDTRRLIPIIIGLMLGMLLAALDQTIVGTAMPRIVTELGGANITWVVC